MKRHRIIIILYFIINLIILGCSPWYGIKNRSNSISNLKGYNKIYIGWLDLGKNNWEKYGYSNQKEWLAAIKNLNHNSLPYYLRKNMPNKEIVVPRIENEAIPKDMELLIKYSNSKYYQWGNTDGEVIYMSEGVKAKDDILETTMQFIDLKTNKELYSIKLTVKADVSMATFGFSLERRLDNAAYYLSRFIVNKII